MDLYHGPPSHFNVKAETLVDGVRLPPNAGLELENLWLTRDKAILKAETQAEIHTETRNTQKRRKKKKPTTLINHSAQQKVDIGDNVVKFLS